MLRYKDLPCAGRTTSGRLPFEHVSIAHSFAMALPVLVAAMMLPGGAGPIGFTFCSLGRRMDFPSSCSPTRFPTSPERGESLRA